MVGVGRTNGLLMHSSGVVVRISGAVRRVRNVRAPCCRRHWSEWGWEHGRVTRAIVGVSHRAVLRLPNGGSAMTVWFGSQREEEASRSADMALPNKYTETLTRTRTRTQTHTEHQRNKS